MPHAPQINEHESCQCHSSEQCICGPAVNTLTAPDMARIYSGVGMRWWCRHPGQHSPRGSKMGGNINILNKQIWFTCSMNLKLLRHIIERQYIIVTFLWPKSMLGAANVSTWSRCQKTSYNTPYKEFKFEGSIHAIGKCMTFISLRLFQFIWWKQTNILIYKISTILT